MNNVTMQKMFKIFVSPFFLAVTQENLVTSEVFRDVFLCILQVLIHFPYETGMKQEEIM